MIKRYYRGCMKHYKTSKKVREAALRYYYEHREEILSKRQTVWDGKCIICGKDLSDMPSRLYRYCNNCINDKKKVSRQARWYRANSKKANAAKRKARIKKEKNK